MDQRSSFFVTFLLSSVRRRTGVADQTRFRAVVRGTDEADVRMRVEAIANALAATFVLEPVEILDDVQGLAPSIRRYCRSHGFELAVDASRSDAEQDCS